MVQPDPTSLSARDMSVPGIPEISCAHEIEIPGSPRINSAVFSPDGETLYLHTSARALDIWGAAWYRWPEWGGAAAGVVVLLAALWIARVLARRQQRGEPHCRKCNYNLSGRAENGDPDLTCRCPECGADLAATPPRPGRRTRRRVLIPATLGTVAVLGYGIPLLAGVPRNLAIGQRQLWPSTRLMTWAESNNIQWLNPFIQNNDLFLEVNFASGEVVRTIATRRFRSWAAIVLSPDGSCIYRRTDRGLESISIATGARVAGIDVNLSLRPGQSAPASVVGFRDGGQEIIFAGWRARDQSTVVAAWDRRSGEVRELLAVPCGGDPSREPMMSVVPDRVAEPSRLLLMSGFTEAYATKTCRLVVCRVDDAVTVEAEYTFPAGSSVRATPMVPVGATPVVSPDGTRAFVSAGSVVTDVLGIDLDTGEPLGQLRSPLERASAWDALALSADGRILVYPLVVQDRLMVRDVHEARWVAQCRNRTDLVRPEPILSADGTHLAAIGTYSTGTNAQTTYSQVLILYDLQPALAPDP